MRQWDKSKPPRGPWTLNRDCPQAQGLVAWYPMGGAAGGLYVPNRAGSTHVSGTGAMSMGRLGQGALSLTAASSQYLGASASPIGTGDCSVHVFASSSSIATTQAIIAIGNSGTNYNEYASLLLVSSNLWANRQSGAAIYNPAQGATTLSSNVEYGLGGIWVGDASRTCYVNGAQDGSNSNSTTPAAPNQINIGKRATNLDTQYFGGLIFEAAVWNVAVPVSTFQRLNDPGRRFELYYPLRSRKWISIGGGTTLTPSVASLALNTYAPTIAQPWAGTPGVAALTLTGYAPSLGLGLTPGVAALTLSTYAPSIAQPWAGTPGVAALTLSTYAPTVTQAGAGAFVPDVAALSLQTYAPSIAQPWAGTPGVAALTLTGYAPSLDLGLTPGVSALALTSYAPTIAQPWAGTPGVAALTLTTYAPTVTQASASPNLQPDVAALTLATYAPDVTQGSLAVGGYGKAKKRYITVVNGKVVVTTSTKAALDAADDAEKITKGKKAPKAPKPEVVEAPDDAIIEAAEIPIEDIRAQAAMFDQERRVMQMFRQRRLAEMVALYESLLRQQDEEDAELLMLAL